MFELMPPSLSSNYSSDTSDDVPILSNAAFNRAHAALEQRRTIHHPLIRPQKRYVSDTDSDSDISIPSTLSTLSTPSIARTEPNLPPPSSPLLRRSPRKRRKAPQPPSPPSNEHLNIHTTPLSRTNPQTLTYPLLLPIPHQPHSYRRISSASDLEPFLPAPRASPTREGERQTTRATNANGHLVHGQLQRLETHFREGLWWAAQVAAVLVREEAEARGGDGEEAVGGVERLWEMWEQSFREQRRVFERALAGLGVDVGGEKENEDEGVSGEGISEEEVQESDGDVWDFDGDVWDPTCS